MLSTSGEAALAAGFAAFNLSDRRAVVAAVSGGGDSLALLLLLNRYLAGNWPRTELVAVTVDHGLRAEAAKEARAVADFCAGLGIEHRTKVWDGRKPSAGVQQAAREARYALLAEAADDAGADLIFAGHTLDDQLETVAMRRRRGDGRGLAGIAPATLYNGRIWIVRPLLDVARETLRAFLRAEKVGWHEDPSNDNRKYERVRTRRALAGGTDVPAARIALAGEMRIAAGERIRLGEVAAELIARHAKKVSAGLYRLDRDFAAASDRDAAVYALRILLAVVGGRQQLADAARSSALFERLSEPRPRATLSRTAIDGRRDGIYLRRELRGLPPAAICEAAMMWDDRHWLEEAPSRDVLVAPFGVDEAGRRARSVEDVPLSLARAGLAAEPALWRGGECLGAAVSTPLIGPWSRFLPSFDIAPARAVTELVGGAPFPAPVLACRKAA